jgi:hypothetical protein
METSKSRSLHLHTLDSLCADLISARPVGVGKDDTPFTLDSKAARAVLNWYFSHKSKWAGRVMEADVDAIVDSAATTPNPIAQTAIASSGAARRYTLVSIQAHQFGGLHHPGTAAGRPADLVFNFDTGVTLFEGFNGCGKTSLLNAIIWTLTGEVLRPQRPPELASTEFACEIDGPEGASSSHTLSPVMPLPDPSFEKPAAAAMPVDTWVRLTFEDDTKAKHVVTRIQKRVGRSNAIVDDISGLDALGLDPVGARVGTTMPGLLPFIQVGSESKLGKAVAELTGMAPLVNLAAHAERAKKKIDGDLTKERKREIDGFDQSYSRSHHDLKESARVNPAIAFPKPILQASVDTSIEATLNEAVEHFEALKARGFADATLVLGTSFNPEDGKQRADLEKSIQPAIAAVGDLPSLPSTSRLGGLSKLTVDESQAARSRITQILDEADALVAMAADATRAGRIRLYTRVAGWIKEHPALVKHEDLCVVCGHDITEAVDPITGLPIKDHLKEAGINDTDFLGQTFAAWSKSVIQGLSHDLPPALAQELRVDLPGHPGNLVRTALIEELFEKPPFQETLGLLKVEFQATCDAAVKTFPAFEVTPLRVLGGGQKELSSLATALERLNKALAFSEWRNDNNASLTTFMQDVVGQKSAAGRETAPDSLLGRLSRLQAMVSGVEPMSQAITLCQRMKGDIDKRRVKEKRLAAYVVTSNALGECMKVGDLAQDQVEQLQKKLHKSAVTWRNRIYLSAFPTTSLDLVATKMSGDGELQLMVGGAGLAAPAQHVSNASALRASLVGFYLAYWEHLLKERGGLRLLLLDDPQELLDGDNREKLADSIKELNKANAQLVMTTHDSRFAASVAKRAQAVKVPLNHQYVHPATKARGTLYTSPSISKVQMAHDLYVSDIDAETSAQEYASECRVFIEGRIGDLFDDAAFPTASTLNFAPTLSDHLGRLRGLMRSGSNELFKSRLLADFCNHPALKDQAPALQLLNKAHHSSKTSIRPKEVSDVLKDLESVRRAAERLHEEFRLFRRREPLVPPVAELAPLEPNVVPSFRVFIQPSLAAFVRDAAVGDTQETEFEEISSDWFHDKAFFLLRSSTLGFAGPASSVAIVEADPSQIEDRSLVIARRGKDVFARRLLRPLDQDLVALAAETPDPRRSPQTLVMHENDVSLHRVVGMLFETPNAVPISKSEAVQIDGTGLLPKVRSAYKIKEESAVPLALPGQIALGGQQIDMTGFDAYIERYVALHLDDGQSIFKRVGDKLPDPLSHLRRFESIGGLGVADILAVGRPQAGFRTVVKAVQVLGVLYHQ